MARYEPQTLRRLLESGSMPVQAVLDFGGQLADALAALQEDGRWFGGLTPESIRITSDGHAELLAPDTEAQGIYRAPESEPGMPGDQFSLGMILAEMLTGAAPVAGAGSQLETLHGRVPEALLEGIRRLTSPNPADRFSSMREAARFMHELKENWHPPVVPHAISGSLIAFLVLFGAIALAVWWTHR